MEKRGRLTLSRIQSGRSMPMAAARPRGNAALAPAITGISSCAPHGFTVIAARTFVKTILQLAQTRDQLKIVADQHGCPTRASDIARACLEIAKRCVSERDHAPYGIYHYAGAGQASWFEFATAIIDLAGKRLSRRPEVFPIPTRDYPTAAIRPLDTRLDCGLVIQNFNLTLQPWQDALADTIDRLLTDRDFQ